MCLSSLGFVAVHLWQSLTETMAGFVMWFSVCWSSHPVVVMVVVCSSKAPIVSVLGWKLQFECGQVSSR